MAILQLLSFLLLLLLHTRLCVIGASDEASSSVESSPKRMNQIKQSNRMPHSDETKRKISKALKGRDITPEHRAKLSASARNQGREKNLGVYAMQGVEKSASQKERMSQSGKALNLAVNLGKYATKGVKRSREQVEKQRATMVGRTYSLQHRQRIGEARKRAWQARKEDLLKNPTDEHGLPKRLRKPMSEEGKKKQSIRNLGRTLTEEHKRKVSASLKESYARKKGRAIDQKPVQQGSRPDLDLNKPPPEDVDK